MSTTVVPKYLPITLNLPTNKKSIFDSEGDLNLNTNIDYPRQSLGFHHYMHSMKKEADVLKQFENKKKVYNVINPFESQIDGTDKHINGAIQDFLKLKKNEVVPDSFLKIWEILFMFNIVQLNEDKYNCGFLTSDNGALNSVLTYRDSYGKSGIAKNDKMYKIKYSNELNTKFVGEIDTMLTTYSTDKRIQNISNIKDKLDLIVADLDIDVEDITVQEQFNLKNAFEQILFAIKSQSKGGNFVIKMYETYTQTSLKLISILMSMYEKVFFTKPLTSKPYLSEKYLVCINFKYSESDASYKNSIKKMDTIMTQLKSNSKLHIVDIFSNFNVDNETLIRVIMINKILLNKQFINLGNVISFINAQNYYGDTYQTKREEQIEAAEYWQGIFLPDISKYKEHQAKINSFSFMSNKINVDKTLEMTKELIL
jgi:hypothetical protein